MNIRRGFNVILIGLIFIVLTGCYPWRSSSLSKVNSAENKLQKAQQAGTINSTIIDNAIDAYKFFAAYFPYDSLTPKFMLREGELYQLNGDYPKAMNALHDVRENYPHSATVADAVFLMAAIDEQNIKNQDSADALYAILLFDYPDSKAAQKTHAILESRGISADDFYKKHAPGLTKAESSGRSDSAKLALRYHGYWK